jgi:hypothetical protein
MFWFPAKDPDISPAVLSELSPMPIIADGQGRKCLHDFISDEISVLLPFLVSVSEVKVYEGNYCIASTLIPPETARHKKGRITVLTEARGEHASRSFFRINFDNEIPPRIRSLPDTPKAVKKNAPCPSFAFGLLG